MTEKVRAYRDRHGNLHVSLDDAIVADLAATLGRVGEQGGMSEGVARLILAKSEQENGCFLGTAQGVVAVFHLWHGSALLTALREAIRERW